MTFLECMEILDRAKREKWDIRATSLHAEEQAIYTERRRLILLVLRALCDLACA